jgi:hypothetical protein
MAEKLAGVPPVEDALQEVCRRYLASHGPATREEFARWWGFAPAAANKVLQGLGGEVALVAREGGRGYVLASDVPALDAANKDERVRLLPMFDAYTLAALPHDALVPKTHRDEVYRKGAWVSQVVMRGGRVVGVWAHERTAAGTRVEVRLFHRNAVSGAELKDALHPYVPFIGEIETLSVV